jgi:hypothetical protein
MSCRNDWDRCLHTHIMLRARHLNFFVLWLWRVVCCCVAQTEIFPKECEEFWRTGNGPEVSKLSTYSKGHSKKKECVARVLMGETMWRGFGSGRGCMARLFWKHAAQVLLVAELIRVVGWLLSPIFSFLDSIFLWCIISHYFPSVSLYNRSQLAWWKRISLLYQPGVHCWKSFESRSYRQDYIFVK